MKIKKIRNCKNFRRFRSNFRIAKVFENSEIFIWKFQMKMIENFIWKFQMKSEFSYENFEWNVDSLQFFLSGYNGCILLVRMKLWVFSYTLTTNCPPKTTQEDDILDKKNIIFDHFTWSKVYLFIWNRENMLNLICICETVLYYFYLTGKPRFLHLKCRLPV